jgi:hypothetical protein
MSSTRPDVPTPERQTFSTLATPSHETWGSNWEPGPAQQRGWRLVGIGVIIGFERRQEGLSAVPHTPILNPDAMDIIDIWRRERHRVLVTPKIDLETGEMAATLGDIGDEVGIIARPLAPIGNLIPCDRPPTP